MYMCDENRSILMKSVPHPENQNQELPPINAAMQAVLTTAANQLARPTGFTQRQTHLHGSDFVRLLVLSWLKNPQIPLEEMAQFGSHLGIQITAQGIHERWNKQTADFLKAVFEVALTQVVVANPVAIPLLARFGAVVVEDSTQIHLLRQLLSSFQASGNVKGKAAEAGCKLHLRLDLLRGGLQCSSLLDGLCADPKTPLAALPQVPRTLNIRDRGFFDLKRLKREAQEGHYSLTYYKSGICLFDTLGEPLDLLLWLAQSLHLGLPLHQNVLVGHLRFPMRLLLSPLPEEQARKRRAVLQRTAQKHSKMVDHRQFLLAGYDVILTNAPAELLNLQEALVLLHLRWQIELLIKLWKQDGLLDEWRTNNPWRVLCEIYAKLIGLLIQHWMLVLGCWQEPHRSWRKAAKPVRDHAIMLAYAYAGDFSLEFVLGKIVTTMQVGSKLNARKNHPNTSQCLFDPPPPFVPTSPKGVG
jgi:DDE family transposase